MIDKILYSAKQNEVTIYYTNRGTFKIRSHYDVIKLLKSLLEPIESEESHVDTIDTTSLDDTVKIDLNKIITKE